MEYWMNTTLSRIHLTFDRSKLSGDRSDVKVIQEEMKVCILHRKREREIEREYVCLSVFTEILFSSSYIFISRTGYIIPRLCAIFFKIECVFSSFF